MPDPQHLYALAALITAATPIVLALIESRRRGRRSRDESRLRHSPRDASE